MKVEPDEVLPLERDSSAAQENVPVMPTLTEEENNDDDQGTSDQVATELRRSTRITFRTRVVWQSCLGNHVVRQQ